MLPPTHAIGYKPVVTDTARGHQLVVSASAERRLDFARDWLLARGATTPLLLVGSPLATTRLVQRSLAPGRASFGWQRGTLSSLAASLAAPELARTGKLPASSLGLEAAACRVIAELGQRGELGRFSGVGERPGLPRAIVRSFRDLTLAGHDHTSLSCPDLSRVLKSLQQELDALGLATQAQVLRAASLALGQADSDLPFESVLLLDPRLEHGLEEAFVAALAQRLPLCATFPHGDSISEDRLARALGCGAAYLEREDSSSSLAQLQLELFNIKDQAGRELDSGVQLMSAPGESRECVEIARKMLELAGHGVRFERMAVLLRSPESYATHISEALERAQIPCYLTRGLRRPDPAGRGLLALLSCRADNYSAARFAEYLSLGCAPLPRGVEASGVASAPGTTDPAGDGTAHWPRATDEHSLLPRADSVEAQAASDAQLLSQARDAASAGPSPMGAPRKWERALNEAAVLGGPDRWKTRLDGLAAEKRAALAEADGEAAAQRLLREEQTLLGLRDFALPIIECLERLSASDSWGGWLSKLGELARLALAQPDRVLELLSQLEPMADVGPVSIHEVQLVLGKSLTQLSSRGRGPASGRVFVASIDDARGLSFDVVFVPGLAEKMFPQKVSEDPLLLDGARAQLSDLLRNDERVALERCALHLVTGAAERQIVFSYPRVDMERARPRVPSFYALEVIRAASGYLPSFEELAERARASAHGRMGWPAPQEPDHAIDDAEYDLALLDSCLSSGDARVRRGAAGYLVTANPHLGRALRFRARRWNLSKWKSADGLVAPTPGARAALDHHQLAARPYSATALEQFASCPYRFYLSAVLRLSPREVAERADELDPMTRGRLIHQVQQRTAEALRDAGSFPLNDVNLPAARSVMRAQLARADAEYSQLLAPAIERVWQDGIAEIERDLHGWLDQLSLDPNWVPIHFELSFGLPRNEHDSASQREAVRLECGITLRGSIDSVERHQLPRGNSEDQPDAQSEVALRATDYKTGRAPDTSALMIRGGKTLQPILYAQALERLFPAERVGGGRLAFHTRRGDYKQLKVPLNAAARDAAKRVAETIDGCLSAGFLPAAPEAKACEYCSFRAVCGPYEEQRTAKKTEPNPHITRLTALRGEY